MSHLLIIKKILFVNNTSRVGKGTFASLIAEALTLNHVDMGKLLRTEIQNASDFGKSLKTYMSKGELVPDKLVNQFAINSIKYSNWTEYKGILLDGFPRNVEQAKYLDTALSQMNIKIDVKAINISLEKWVAVEKCLGRRVCKTCKKGFNTAHIVEEGFDMPAIHPYASTCKNIPSCAPILEKRDDDDIDIITKRFDSFNVKTKPLLDYYKSKGGLKSFEVKRGIKDTNLLIDLMHN